MEMILALVFFWLLCQLSHFSSIQIIVTMACKRAQGTIWLTVADGGSYTATNFSYSFVKLDHAVT